MENKDERKLPEQDVLDLLEDYGVTKERLDEEEKRCRLEEGGKIPYDGMYSCISLLRYRPFSYMEYEAMLYPIEEKIQLIDLVLFAHACGNQKSSIKLSGSIKNPLNGQRKGQRISVSIDGKLLETLLPKDIKDTDIEELKKERDKKATELERTKFLTKCGLVGHTLDTMLLCMDMEVFDGWNQRKIYCFLYDLCVLHGIAPDMGKAFAGDTAKEKEDWVKYRLKAYSENYWNSWYGQMLKQCIAESKQHSKKQRNAKKKLNESAENP